MITRKLKKCKICSNECYIFSKGRCEQCSRQSYGSPKKVSSKQKVKIEQKKELLIEDKIFYLSIWEERKDSKGLHSCEVCDEPIYGEPLTLYFDHLLEKSKFPQFRHTKENVAIVCGDCHSSKTNGNPKPKHKILIMNAIKILIK